NISMEREALFVESLAVATAVHNAGGLVIVQVERIADGGALRPKDVKIPGVLVDCVVVSTPEHHPQTWGTQYSAAFSGELRVPLSSIPPLELTVRKVIARRAAMELRPNAVVNLGIGIPEGVAAVAAEEHILDYIVLTAEPGGIGGLPAGGKDFGSAINGDATRMCWPTSGSPPSSTGAHTDGRQDLPRRALRAHGRSAHRAAGGALQLRRRAQHLLPQHGRTVGVHPGRRRGHHRRDRETAGRGRQDGARRGQLRQFLPGPRPRRHLRLRCPQPRRTLLRRRHPLHHQLVSAAQAQRPPRPARPGPTHLRKPPRSTRLAQHTAPATHTQHRQPIQPGK
ncbi:MAG: hypothetical protein JOZ49_12375, partial [Mycolicibacterium sp.]|nr:hypothetical protein [Mycolicibacterium sp.]